MGKSSGYCLVKRRISPISRPKLISSERGLCDSRCIELRFWPFSPKVFHRVRDTSRNKARLPPWMITLVAIFSLWEAVSLTGVVSSDQLPPLHNVILTLLVTVIGRGNVAAVAISAFSAFFPIYFTIMQGVKEIPIDYFHVASVFKAGRLDTFSKIILPSIFPNFLTGLRLSFEFSWNVLLAVEIIASVAGVGSFISNSIQGSAHSITYGLAAIMTVGFLTILMDRAFFERLEQRIKRWR